MNLTQLTLQEARTKLDAKEITVKDLVGAYRENIEAKNEELNIFLEVFDDIDAQVDAAQAIIDAGEAQTLTGIPIALKDNICIKGRIASAASKYLEEYTAPYNATVTEKLLPQTPIFLGRVNMDEFAMGGSTENSAYGVTKNPHDTDRVPGGSSGGSATAVAAECALLTLGSDTGGSIRQPASFCGVVGLKPTYGSVSRHGLMAMSSSLDVIGPITKTVADAKSTFDIIKGKDPLDSTSDEKDPVERKESYKIGVPRAFLTDEMDADVLEAFEQDLKALQEQGHEVVNVELPSLKYSLAVYYIIMPSEVSSNMSRYDGVRFGAHIEGKTLEDDYKKTRSEFLGEEVKRRIMLGTYALSSGYYDAYYNKAWQVRTKMKEEIAKVFESVDVIMLPTSPTPAFKVGENTEDPLKMYLTDILTVSVNLVGVPAISIPSQSVDRDGKQLPVGSQILGPHFHEEWLFDLGGQLE